METATLQAVAPAKLNLSLHVLGKRPNGYHELESVVAFTEFGDLLTFKPASDITLEVTGPFAGSAGDTESNLVLRAARLMQAYGAAGRGVHITLEKRIPVGAGLGGGSSDAATTLRILRAMWGLAVNDATLADIAVSLGADVPMCLHDKPLLAEGIGERVISLPYALPEFHVVLVYPNEALATQVVFSRYQPDATPPSTPWLALNEVSVLPALQLSRNMLQRAATAQCAAVGEVLLMLETAVQQPELVRMSGSGSCCFALFEDAQRAAGLVEDIKKRYPHWWVASSTLRR